MQMVRDELQFARSKNILGLREDEEIAIEKRDFEVLLLYSRYRS